jgi:endonuclease/exonuclease/phosphatase family metal-dependent hydrolase
MLRRSPHRLSSGLFRGPTRTRTPTRTEVSGLLLLAFLAAGCADHGPTDPVSSLGAPSLGPPPEAAIPGEVRVLTRNLYLGGDIGPILAAQSQEELLAAAATAWNQIQLTDYPARAARLAEEISYTRPDLVGLQEVTRYTVGDFPPPGEELFPTEPLLDFLPVLQAQLAARGLLYDAVIRQPNIRVALPVAIGGEMRRIGYEDSDAILIRGGIPWTGADARLFQAMPPLEFTAGIPFRRGWTQVDAQVGGRWVRFVNTHLEIQSFRPIQEAQTAELLAALADSPHPLILVGDFNSAANPSAPEDRKTGSYTRILNAGFFDLWDREDDPDGGLTCCHYPNLANATAEVLDQRLDIVFVRNRAHAPGFAGGSFVEVVGASPEDRFQGSLGQPLWPSDHAGLAASVILPPPRVAGGG